MLFIEAKLWTFTPWFHRLPARNHDSMERRELTCMITPPYYFQKVFIFGFTLRGVFEGTNIAGFFVSIRSFHAALVGGNAVNLTGIKRDLVDSWTTWE